jgi:hypothetical protein
MLVAWKQPVDLDKQAFGRWGQTWEQNLIDQVLGGGLWFERAGNEAQWRSILGPNRAWSQVSIRQAKLHPQARAWDETKGVDRNLIQMIFSWSKKWARSILMFPKLLMISTRLRAHSFNLMRVAHLFWTQEKTHKDTSWIWIEYVTI